MSKPFQYKYCTGLWLCINCISYSETVQTVPEGGPVGPQGPGQILQAFHYRDRHVYISLHKQYVRPHLEFAVAAWSPWTKAAIDCLEKVQVKAVSRLRGRSYEERTAELGLPTAQPVGQAQTGGHGIALGTILWAVTTVISGLPGQTHGGPHVICVV